MPDSDSDLGALADALRTLVAHHDVWRPSYAHTPVYTYGGPTGSMDISPPYNTPCEWLLVAVSFEDVGSVAISSAGGVTAPAAGATFDPSVYTPRTVLQSNACHLVPAWQPLPADQALHLAMVVTNNKSAYVCLQFRRRINAAGVYAEG